MELGDYEAVFDSGHPDYSGAHLVFVAKVGGGTLGNDYVGDWEVAVTPIKDRDDILWSATIGTDMHKSHEDVAQVAFDFFLDREESE